MLDSFVFQLTWVHFYAAAAVSSMTVDYSLPNNAFSKYRKRTVVAINLYINMQAKYNKINSKTIS